MKNDIKRPGKITISRTFSSYEKERPVHIEIIDDTSRIHIIEVRMSLENFAIAVTGQGHVDCELVGNPEHMSKFGLDREMLEVIVNLDEHKGKSETELKEIMLRKVSKYKLDGWEFSGTNENNQTRNKRMITTMVRYIKPKE